MNVLCWQVHRARPAAGVVAHAVGLLPAPPGCHLREDWPRFPWGPTSAATPASRGPWAWLTPNDAWPPGWTGVGGWRSPQTS